MTEHDDPMLEVLDAAEARNLKTGMPAPKDMTEALAQIKHLGNLVRRHHGRAEKAIRWATGWRDKHGRLLSEFHSLEKKDHVKAEKISALIAEMERGQSPALERIETKLDAALKRGRR